jgi:ABC-type glycerol-3-phosphate transport system substrate-binding protein
MNRGMTRRALALGTAPALGLLAVGCGTGAGQGKPAVSIENATLTYLDRGANYATFHQDRAKAFMQQFKGAKVSGEQMTGTTDEQVAKLVAASAAGTPPDLAIHLDHNQTIRLAAGGTILEPLDTYIAREKQLHIEDIHPEVQAQYRYQKKTYGIGHGVALSTLFVNPDMFKAAGVALPPTDWKDAKWTMDALADAAQRLTKPNGRGGFDQVGIVAEQIGWNGNIGNWVMGNGGAFLDDMENPKKCILDSAQTREALQFITDLRQKRQVWADGEQLEGQLPQQWFASGKAAMYFGGSFKVNAIKMANPANTTWDIAPLPRFKQPVVGFGGSGVSMLSGTKQKDAAWELLRFMVDEEYNRQQFKLGLDTPARTSVLSSAEFLNDAPPPKSRKVFAESMQYGKAKNIRAVKGPDIEAALNKNVTSLLNGKMSVSDFITQTCSAVSPLF